MRLKKREIFLDVFFFLGYPIFCLFFMWTKLPLSWTFNNIRTAGLNLLFTSTLFTELEAKEGINRLTVTFMIWVSFLFQVGVSLPYNFLGSFWGSALLAVMFSWAIEKVGLRKYFDKAKHGEIYLLIWFYFVFMASILTTKNLIKVHNLTSLFPLFLIGLPFSWFSHEFGHSLYRIKYFGGWGGFGAQWIFWIITSILYLFLIPEYSLYDFLTLDYVRFSVSSFNIIPTMLVSRMISEYVKYL